jgi:beta-barrel assembly-enhancing protease
VRVPGSFGSVVGGGGLVRSVVLTFLLISFAIFSVEALAEAQPEAGDLPGEQGAMVLPAVMMGRAPAIWIKPLRVKAPKKVDPKYDIAKIGLRGVGTGLDFYSLEREVQYGRDLAREVENQVRLVSDPVVTEYVNRLGQRLVRNSDAKVPFTIKVIDSDEINAFALPGGFFYVNTGMILAAENEAELAGVMAHEIAHVAARHATKNESRQNMMEIASMPLIFFGGPVAMMLRQAVNIAIPLSYLKFGRDAEREADMLGLQYQYACGYDPEEFVRLFEKLEVTEKKDKNLVDKAFATHPMTSERIKRAQAEIATYLPSRDDYVVDTSEFQEVRARVMELSDRRKIDMGKVTPTLLHRDKELSGPVPGTTQDSGNVPDESNDPDHQPMTDATDWQKLGTK